MQVSRAISANPELFEKTKTGNLVNVKLRPNAFDLIKAGVKFKQSVKTLNALRKYPARSKEQRINAIKIADTTQMLDLDDRVDIEMEFTEYIKIVEKLKIILKKRAQADPLIFSAGARYKILPYTTRFTDKKIPAKTLDKIDHAFAYMSKRYKKGVHLTLTTDPKRFYSLYAANRHFSIAFNRYLSYLSRKRGSRLPYISAYEFTKSGLLHAHVLFFGISYLDHKHAISEDWDRCGQGSITYIYAIRNENGKWIYSRNQPKDLKKGDTAADYLKKYIKKSIYEPNQAMLYWTFNKRYFTCTRAALPTTTILTQIKGIPPIWEFYMAVSYLDMPDFIFHEVLPPPKPQTPA